MVNAQIIEFIKNQLQLGVSREKITTDLLSNGWTSNDINEAFSASAAPQNAFSVAPPAQAKNSNTIIFSAVTFIVLLLFGGGLFAYYKYQNNDISKVSLSSGNAVGTTSINEIASQNVLSDGDEVVTNTTQSPIATTSTSSAVAKVSNLPKATSTPIKSTATASASVDLWAIYDKMTLALKNKDVDAFNAVSYDQVPSSQKSQFNQIATFLYDQSIKIDKSSYVNKWQDSKQAIYSTNPEKMDDDEVYKYSQGTVMFINKDGSWKILLTSPERGWNVVKSGTNSTPAQIEKDLQAMMLDSDKDGKKNDEETCSNGEQYNSRCVKSDPNKRDTNGNGWWDGIEANMK